MEEQDKQITGHGLYPHEYWEYSDGSMKGTCHICGMQEEVKPDKALKLRKNPEWHKNYTCYKCWKDGLNVTGMVLSKDEIIMWSQAYNLAQCDVASQGLTPDEESYWLKLKEWRTMHFNALKEMRSQLEKHVEVVNSVVQKAKSGEPIPVAEFEEAVVDSETGEFVQDAFHQVNDGKKAFKRSPQYKQTLKIKEE